MIVFTAEMISMMRRFMQGFGITDQDLALDVIDQIGPGGDFLASDHTFEGFRHFWQPDLFSRQRVDDWIQEGSLDLGDRLRKKTLSLIENHKSDPLSQDVKEQVNEILAKI
jgi:trimethylamine--corrinoid protein Co-methyltransferase